MPPKVRITREDILRASLELVRAGGIEGINARAVAAALPCSTQPIFSNFATMEELQEATIAAAHEHYLGFLTRELERGVYPPYKSFGMGYIRFAEEEPELFKLLFLCDRGGKELSPTADVEQSVAMIMAANGVSRETAELWHLEMWTCVHGIGTMLATSFLSPDRELISRMLTDIYQGLRTRHTQPKEE